MPSRRALPEATLKPHRSDLRPPFSANKTFEYRGGKDIAYSARNKCQQGAKPWNNKVSSGAVVGSILIDGTAGEVLISYVCCMQFDSFSNPLTEKKIESGPSTFSYVCSHRVL